MAFYSEEYKHLLLAERVTTSALEGGTLEPNDIAQLSRALVAIIAQKRNLRMRPNPKPVDVSAQRRPKRAPALAQPAPIPAPVAQVDGEDTSNL